MVEHHCRPTIIEANDNRVGWNVGKCSSLLSSSIGSPMIRDQSRQLAIILVQCVEHFSYRNNLHSLLLSVSSSKQLSLSAKQSSSLALMTGQKVFHNTYNYSF